LTREGKYLKFSGETSSYDMIYLLTAIGLTPGGSSTVHIYTQTVHRTTQKKQYIKQHKKIHRTKKKQYIKQHKINT
jgi:hypothetical protein